MKLSHKPKIELAVAAFFMLPAVIALFEIMTKFVEKGMHTGGGEQNAALFPRLLSILLLVLSALRIIGILIESGKSGLEDEKPFYLFEPEGRKRTAVVLLIFVLYIIGLSIFGYYAATPLTLAAFFIALGIKKIQILIPLSLAVTMAVWYVFGILLKVVLPVGQFGLYF